MNVQIEPDWLALNQQILTAEFDRIGALLDSGTDSRPVNDAQSTIEKLQARIERPAAIDALTRSFQLTSFERDILLLAAGVEMDSRIANSCAFANGEQHKPWATFGIAMSVFSDPHWSALAPVEALRHWRLVDLDEGAVLTSAQIRIEERVLHFLGGLNYLDHRLQTLFEAAHSVSLLAEEHKIIASDIATALQYSDTPPPIILLNGDDADGQRDIASFVSSGLGLNQFVLRASDIPASPNERASLAALWQREAALLNACMLVTQNNDFSESNLTGFVEQVEGLVFVAGKNSLSISRPLMRYTVDKPGPKAQLILWKKALGEHADPMHNTLSRLAGQYRLGARKIASHVEKLKNVEFAQHARTLEMLCRGDDTSLGPLAQEIQARAGWDDLVLPAAQRNTLEQIVVHVCHRTTVQVDWGFAAKGTQGLGISALFAGESGTGKTLAAEVLATTLNIALYRIDLSAVVSKYIGETEKNLCKVFDAAENLGAILLFDEADALFGKRSDVKDSHDRHANIEVSYLLQRMEQYWGIAILTTNHKSRLDQAFMRRLRFIINFPFPDAAQREAIWRGVFPTDTPIANLDYEKLSRLNVTGGNIRNIALAAAFLAAEEKSPVSMSHLLKATHIEVAKVEKSPSDAETRGWI